MKLVLKGIWAVPVIASILIIGGFGISQQAYAVPTLISSSDAPSCDPLSLPVDADELGTNPPLVGPPFPADEEILSSFFSPDLSPPCPSAPDGPDPNPAVGITNTVSPPQSFFDVYYVADPDTSISNIDGFVDGFPAFRIDAVGINTPLLSESLTPDGIFEPGELWLFVIQDFINFGGATAESFNSIGVGGPSSGSGLGDSSGSIIVFVDHSVGGTVLPIDTTALLVAGAQTTTSWLILGIVAAVGIGIAVFTLKRSR